MVADPDVDSADEYMSLVPVCRCIGPGYSSVFCFFSGVGCSVLAAVSFVHVVGSRDALVVLRVAASFVLFVGSRLALVVSRSFVCLNS